MSIEIYRQRVNRIAETIFPEQGCEAKRQQSRELQAIRRSRYVKELEALPEDKREGQVKEWETRYNVI